MIMWYCKFSRNV